MRQRTKEAELVIEGENTERAGRRLDTGEREEYTAPQRRSKGYSPTIL